MSGMDMAYEQAVKMLVRVFKINPDQVKAQVQGIGDKIGSIDTALSQLVYLELMNTRRLARIERHLNLEDIEPVPQLTKVIEHAEISVPDGSVPSDAAGAR